MFIDQSHLVFHCFVVLPVVLTCCYGLHVEASMSEAMSYRCRSDCLPSRVKHEDGVFQRSGGHGLTGFKLSQDLLQKHLAVRSLEAANHPLVHWLGDRTAVRHQPFYSDVVQLQVSNSLRVCAAVIQKEEDVSSLPAHSVVKFWQPRLE